MKGMQKLLLVACILTAAPWAANCFADPLAQAAPAATVPNKDSESEARKGDEVPHEQGRASAESIPPKTGTQAYRTSRYAVAIAFGSVLIFLVMSLSLVRRSLKDSKWSLADALSENVEATLPSTQAPAPPLDAADTGPKPIIDGSTTVLVGSTSRLIAFIGMLVLVAFYIGVGFWLLWDLFTTGQAPDMSNLLNFFFGGAVLFAPYAFNQMRAAVGKLVG